MSNIQQAREILKSRRREAKAAGGQLRFWSTQDLDAAVKPVIILTAANKDFLDAVDALLALAIEYGDLLKGQGSRFIERAERVAEAIIWADTEMES